MKAARLNEWGKALELEDVPQPEPGHGQVLVRVHAASINPFDSAVQAGYLAFMSSVPLTFGTDFAGEVVSLGEGTNHFKPGDPVYGCSPLGSGTLAEYTVVKENELAHRPQSIDPLCASGVPLPAMAAWLILYEQAGFKPGERILVHGVSGNVGSIVTQLAKNDGGYVYGTDIAEKREHITKLGLDRFIDTDRERFEDVVEDLDAVIDLVGGEFTQRSYSVLAPGKRYATSMVLEPEQDEPKRLGITSRGLGAYPRREVLEQMASLIDSGKVQVFVNRVFPLEQANEALAYRLQSRTPGKVIITIS